MRYIMKAAAPAATHSAVDAITEALFSQSTDRRASAVDVRELSDRYILEAELPGVSQQEIEVRVEDTLLTVAARKTEKPVETDTGVRYLLRERQPVMFNRSFALPGDVNRDTISANVRDGVLTLVLEKRPESMPRTIPVNG